MPPGADPRPVAVLSINTTWNLVNFRSGLIRALVAAHWRVICVSPPDDYVDRLLVLGVEHVPIAMDNKGASPRRDATLFRDYLRIMRRLRPAVYLGWTIKPNVYGSLAARMVGARIVNNISGLGTAFIAPGLLTRIVTGLYRVALAGAHTVFFQNADDRALFVDRHMVAAGKARLLPGSGIDLTCFVATPLPEHAAPVFLLPARLLWDKGVGEFVAAARFVRAQVPQARFQLLGFLDVANRTAVPRAVLERWVAEGIVEYLGATDDVRPFIAAADCVVLPSYREGLPRSLLEAAAMGRPLIAADAPGCRDIARAGVNGLLAPVGDADGLAAAMLAFAALDREARQRLGDASRALAEREFDEKVVIARYLDAIAGAAA